LLSLRVEAVGLGSVLVNLADHHRALARYRLMREIVRHHRCGAAQKRERVDDQVAFRQKFGRAAFVSSCGVRVCLLCIFLRGPAADRSRRAFLLKAESLTAPAPTIVD
jgi:hypothetical protein